MLRWLWTETRITSLANQTYKKWHLVNPILGGTKPLPAHMAGPTTHRPGCELGGELQLPGLGGETRTRKPSWRQGFHFIRYIKQKMNSYTAGRHRAETLFLHQNGHRNHRLYTGTWATSPNGAGQLPPRWREPQRSRQRTHNWATKRVGTGRTTSN